MEKTKTELDEKIQESFREKTSHEKASKDSWMVFKIMGELVKGYEKMSEIGPCVTIFGSARIKPENPYYQIAMDTAIQIGKLGFGIVTGGGPGIMEAANKGAKENRIKSIGLNVELPFETGSNPYVDHQHNIHFEHFFIRKAMFMKYSQAFVVFPGGFGTLDELLEALTLIQTKKMSRFPIILVGKEFWDGLITWFKTTLLEMQLISKEDFSLFKIVNTANEATSHIKSFYDKYQPTLNF